MSRVAVIGLGASGLAALKNLREAGLDAVGFERNPYVGGIWQYTTNENVTSVIQSTRTNTSKYRFTFSDFEYPSHITDSYPLAKDVANYLQAYAENFNLNQHCRLGVTIVTISRSEKAAGWDVKFTDNFGVTKTEKYDKVIVCTGPQNKALLPKHEGISNFKGRILHSQNFKDSKPFAGQRVVVVGISNTAGDVAVDLAGVCEEVYVSHRSGVRVANRGPNDQAPFDQKVSRRLTSILLTLKPNFPHLMGMVGGFMLEATMKSQFKKEIKKEWRLLPAPPVVNVVPVMNDYLLDYLDAGRLKSVHGIKRYLDDGTSIEMEDGEILRSIDAVIYCTGYTYDYSYLEKEANPTAFPTPEWDRMEHAGTTRYPRLYWGIFSTEYPESLAFIGPYRGHSLSAFSNSDLMSTAVSQIWAGNYPVPTKPEMDAWCNAHYLTTLKYVSHWRLSNIAADSGALSKWLNDAAGNGINENLGWGWEGWQFWWNNMGLYYTIMDGVDSAHIQRLFNGRSGKGRKRWDGAKNAIYQANTGQLGWKGATGRLSEGVCAAFCI
ncbi:hypothetical protein TWF730_001489 [Orbilia blumenaviensis]|uniref:Flavin-containing monooxygenase n=1 Tax=Orbilia blumenaviensis TaxID=1796055 RepID=A0AAV9UL75_9PEZI